jgi:peptide/nickel transport system permease protein
MDIADVVAAERSADASSPAPTARPPTPARRRRQVARYLAMRLLVFLITLWGAYTISFLFFRLMPGDPVQAFIANLAINGEHIDAAAAAEQSKLVNQTLGRDGNLFEQYVLYFSRVLRGDFGASFLNFPNPAIQLVLRALPWTATLLAVSVVLGWGLGLALGALIGWQRNRPWAQGLAAFAIALEQVPFYFLALLLLIVFGYGLAWFPTRGAYHASVAPGLTLAFLGSAVQHAILPALSLVLISACRWAISTRALMISVLGEDYLLYAQARGLPPRTILYRYALRNALLPQITALAISLGFVINGAILLEQLFLYPGVGLLLISAIKEIDVNTAQAIVIMTITSVMTANLIVDLILPFVDPRVQARV